MTGGPDNRSWPAHWDTSDVRDMLVTVVVYLNEGFEGGDFVFYNDTRGEFEIDRIKPRAGLANFFTSGKENIHGVETVTAGERLTLVIYFRGETPKYTVLNSKNDGGKSDTKKMASKGQMRGPSLRDKNDLLSKFARWYYSIMMAIWNKITGKDD